MQVHLSKYTCRCRRCMYVYVCVQSKKKRAKIFDLIGSISIPNAYVYNLSARQLRQFIPLRATNTDPHTQTHARSLPTQKVGGETLNMFFEQNVQQPQELKPPAQISRMEIQFGWRAQHRMKTNCGFREWPAANLRLPITDTHTQIHTCKPARTHVPVRFHVMTALRGIANENRRWDGRLLNMVSGICQISTTILPIN